MISIHHFPFRSIGISRCTIKFWCYPGPDSKNEKQLITKNRVGEKEIEKEIFEDRLDILGYCERNKIVSKKHLLSRHM